MDKSYWELFFGESQEYLRQINHQLVALEKNPSNSDALNEIFRLMHTLKGMAATMGFNDFAELAHNVEDIFDNLRSHRQKVTTEVMDVIFSCVDAFGVILEELRAKKKISVNVSQFISRLKGLSLTKEAVSDVPKEPQTTVDFSKEQLLLLDERRKSGFDIFTLHIELSPDCQMKEARIYLILIRIRQLGDLVASIPQEELLRKGAFDTSFSVIIATKEDAKVIKDEITRVLEVQKVIVNPFKESMIDSPDQAKTPRYLKKIQSMRIPVERLDKIMNFMGELSIAKSRLMQTLQLNDMPALEETAFIIDRLVSSLQDEILQMRLLPISYTLDTFPRIVRDLGRKSDKDIELQIVGSEIEIDRVVLDEIGDPLVHIVRNAIDHGIENVASRKKAGKNPKGSIVINVSREKGHVIIEISDDGRGIDFKKIAERAVEKGFINEHDALAMDEQQILDVMTLPGFSTRTEVTDISGRGVGLDVVKAKIDYLGGRLDFESELGKGTRFILTLPLTLAIIKAMLVKAGEQIFAIPLMNIRESVKVDAHEVKTIDRVEVIRLRDDIIPLVRLDKELGITYAPKTDSRLSVIIVEGRMKGLGLLVDKIIGEQDVVVKPLGSIVRKIRGIAGATILGDGRVALILDVVNLK